MKPFQPVTFSSRTQLGMDDTTLLLIFQINTFKELTFHLNSLFLIQHTKHSICSGCNQVFNKSTDVFVLYNTHRHIIESSVSEAMLLNINRLLCLLPKSFWKCSFVCLPTLLMIELSPDLIT